jgi:GT2 family glycosyltransferase
MKKSYFLFKTVINPVHGITVTTFMTKPKVLISILNWNNAKDTSDCIKSVLQSSYDNYKIVIVDNASRDNSAIEIQKSFPYLDYIQSEYNLGYAGGHNLVLEKYLNENYDLFLVLNNDIIFEKDTLLKLVTFYKNNPHSIACPVTLEQDNKTIRFGGSYEMENNKVLIMKGWNKLKGTIYNKQDKNNLIRETSDVNGACMIIPINIIKQHGFISPKFFLYAEETFYCFDLREKANIKSYIIEDTTIVHKGSNSFSNNALKHIGLYYRKRNSLILQKKYFGLSNKDIFKTIFKIQWLVPFAFKYFIFKLKKTPYIENRFFISQLATFHAFTNKLGKTIHPEKFI